MNLVPNYFVSVGHSYFVNTSKVCFIVRPDTAQGRRVKLQAQEIGSFLDYTFSKKTKALVVMDDATVIASAISPETLCKRFNSFVYKDDDD